MDCVTEFPVIQYAKGRHLQCSHVEPDPNGNREQPGSVQIPDLIDEDAQ